MVYSVTVTQLIEKMDLKNHTPEIDTDKILIQDPGMNRPAVQFEGSLSILMLEEYRYVEM